MCPTDKSPAGEEKTNGDSKAEEKSNDSGDKLAEQLGDLSVKDAAGGDTPAAKSDATDTAKPEEKDWGLLCV